jgi:sec-independent protein translocase protein TatB
MNLFGMGSWEIGLILIVALIIFGPGKLPEVAGQVGKAVRDFRRITSDMTGEFERQTGVKDIKKTLEAELTGVKNEVSGVGKSIEKDLQKSANTVNSTVNSAKSSTKSTGASTSSAAKSSSSTAKTGTSAASKSASSAKPAPAVATKKDPLADLMLFDEEAGPATTAPVTPAASPSSTNGSAEPSETIVAADALSRARLRRQRAGYNRTTGPSA